MSKKVKRLNRFRISRKSIKGPSYLKISRNASITHPLFNFAFISSKNKFGLSAAKKNTRFEYALLKKLYKLSNAKDLASCISLRKNAGIEPLPEDVLRPNINNRFLKSYAYSRCNPSIYSFRTSKQGRVIGCIWQEKNIFYVLFLDPKHRAYAG